MNNYFNVWKRLHHKPCINGEPSSNNGWIYTAYHYKLYNIASYYQGVDLKAIGYECSQNLTRHPLKYKSKELQVPISRDEILGLAFLKHLNPTHLNGWSFSPYPIPPFNLKTLIKQIKELNGQHRNYFWQNKLDQIYRFAFSVPLQDRAFLLECWGETKSLRYFFYKSIAMIDSKFFKPKNGIHWLKYGGEERKKIMQGEFPEDHPLRQL